MAGRLLKGSGRSAEQEIVNQLLVRASELAQGVGQGEGHQKMSDRQEQFLLASQPGGGIVIAAFGAMAILTGVIAVAELVAWSTVIHLPAQSFRTAVFNGLHHP
jgi:hypothetical protein